MRRSKSGLPKYCSYNPDRHGKQRVRFRKGSFETYIYGTPWSSAFMEQRAAALEGVKARPSNIGAERTLAGSLDELIVSYYKLVLPTLKPSTRKKRRAILERVRSDHGKKPVARLEHGHVASMFAAKANTPAAANNLLKVMRHLLDHAVAIKMISANPALGVKKFKITGDGIHTWTEDEVVQFIARHPLGTLAYLALVLLLYTGQRLSDVIRMGWQHCPPKTGKIEVRQEKTDARLLIPIEPELAQALAHVPRTNMTFLLSERGAPFTPEWFGTWMRKRCDEAGLPQCSSHGLRKLAATRLANAGCSEREIMAITGHRSPAQVSPYTKKRDQVLLAEQAMAKRRTKQHTEFVPPSTGLDKTAE